MRSISDLWKEAAQRCQVPVSDYAERITFSYFITESDEERKKSHMQFDHNLLSIFEEAGLCLVFLYLDTIKMVSERGADDLLRCLSSIVSGMLSYKSAVFRLITCGNDVPARGLVRTLREYAVLGNYLAYRPEVRKNYLDSDTPETSYAFWRQHLSKRKASDFNIRKTVNNFGLAQESILEEIADDRESDLLLSMSIHPGYFQSTRTVLAPSMLDNSNEERNVLLPHLLVLGNRTRDSEYTLRQSTLACADFLLSGAQEFYKELLIDVEQPSSCLGMTQNFALSRYFLLLSINRCFSNKT
jgi:hypothetical protein